MIRPEEWVTHCDALIRMTDESEGTELVAARFAASMTMLFLMGDRNSLGPEQLAIASFPPIGIGPPTTMPPLPHS